MKEPRSPLPLVIARRLALKFTLVVMMLSATAVVYADTGYFWETMKNGDTAWLWCGPNGNYWTRCDTGSCPLGQSCPCYICTTSECQATADEHCALLGY